MSKKTYNSPVVHRVQLHLEDSLLTSTSAGNRGNTLPIHTDADPIDADSGL